MSNRSRYLLGLAILLFVGFAVTKLLHDRTTLASTRPAGQLISSDKGLVQTTTGLYSVNGPDFSFDRGRPARVELREFIDGSQTLCVLAFNENYEEQCRHLSRSGDK